MSLASSGLMALQSAQAGASNGNTLPLDYADRVLVEISGTYTNMTANFEATLDGGTTWDSVSLATLSSTTLARLAAATAVGLYLLEYAAGLNGFRARTTVSTPTGSMTVKAVGLKTI